MNPTVGEAYAKFSLAEGRNNHGSIEPTALFAANPNYPAGAVAEVNAYLKNMQARMDAARGILIVLE